SSRRASNTMRPSCSIVAPSCGPRITASAAGDPGRPKVSSSRPSCARTRYQSIVSAREPVEPWSVRIMQSPPDRLGGAERVARVDALIEPQPSDNTIAEQPDRLPLLGGQLADDVYPTVRLELEAHARPRQ